MHSGSDSDPAVYPGSPLCRRVMNFMTMMSSEVLLGRKDLSFGMRVPRSICVGEMAGTGAAWVSFKMAAKIAQLVAITCGNFRMENQGLIHEMEWHI